MKTQAPRITLLAFALLSLGTTCASSPSPQPVLAGDIAQDAATTARQAAFERTMQQHAVPGAQLVHVHADAYAQYVHGVASQPGGEKVSDRTTFEAASLSKVVGAYIALRLVDQGKLDLDTPLWDYWQSPRTRDNAMARKITARMVLNHTTGLPNWEISPSNPAIDTTPLTSQFAPGTRFHYSGEGFYLLQKTIEHITGMRWNDLAKSEVFSRFDMRDSRFLTDPASTHPGSVGHESDGKARPRRIFAWENTAWTLTTNARDYSRFVQGALFKGEGLKPSTHALMLAASSDADEADFPNPADPFVSWGLGVGLQQVGERTLAWHWGDNPGYKALFMLDLRSGDSIVLFTNSENGPATYKELLRLFMGPGEYPAVDWVAAQG